MNIEEALRLINLLNEELTNRKITLGELACINQAQSKEIASLKRIISSLRKPTEGA